MGICLPIIVSTASVYLFIVIFLRIFGKTELAQLSVTDLIFVFLICNAVQNAMVGAVTSLQGGLVAASSVLFVMNFLFKKLKYNFYFFRKVIEGDPVLLIHNGKVLEENCFKNISKEELLQAIREHGSDAIEEVDSLILEADGNVSVVTH